MSVNVVRGGLQVVTCKAETTFASQPLTEILGMAIAGAAGVFADILKYHPGVKPKSFVANSYTAGGALSQTITDDGNGNLIGNILVGATNTINYITGAVSMSFANGAVSASARADYDVVGNNNETAYTLEALTAGIGAGQFTDILVNKPDIKPQSVVVLSNTGKTAPDLGNGTFNNADVTGTINYTTGEIDVTFSDGVLSVTATVNYIKISDETQLNYTGEAIFHAGAGVFTDTLVNKPKVKPHTFVATGADATIMYDDGEGNIIGSVAAGTNTINYETGAVTFVAATGVAADPCTASYSVINDKANLLYLAGRAGYNEVGNAVPNPQLKGSLMEGDEQITDFDGDNDLPVSVRVNESGYVNLVGANGKLIEGFFGHRKHLAQSASVVAAAISDSQFTLGAGDGLNHDVGELIAVQLTLNGTGQIEVAQITAISTDTITVSPAFSVNPGAADAVLESTNFWFNDPEDDPDTLWLNIYRGKNFGIECAGQRVNALSWEFPVSALVGLKVTTKGAGGPTKTVKDEITTPFNQIGQSDTGKQPLTAMSMALAKEGTRLSGCKVMNASVNMSADSENDKTIDGGDTVCRSLRGMVKIDGKVDVFLQDKTDYTKFTSETRGSLLLVAGRTARNMLAVMLPRVKYSAVSIDEENVQEKLSLSFKAEEPIIDGVRLPSKTAVVAIFGLA